MAEYLALYLVNLDIYFKLLIKYYEKITCSIIVSTILLNGIQCFQIQGREYETVHM